MSIMLTLIGAVVSSGSGAPPTPTYTLTPAANNVNEGSSLTFTVGGTNIPDGNYLWTIETGAEDFTTTSGSITVTSNSGTFTVTPTADDTTEGPGAFTVSLRTGPLEPNLVTSQSVTINDTSLDPTSTYEITPTSDNVDEGSSLEFTVSGTNIPDGTYYWIVTNSGDFGTSSGEVEITSDAGSFTVSPTADENTEGSETFTVQLRSGSINGTLLATSETVYINDTSLTPVPPFSMAFTGARRLAVGGNPSDWNLGTTWTLEWWSKTTTPSTSVRTVMGQAPSAGSIDVYYQNGNGLAMSNGTALAAEPPVGGVPFGDVTKTSDNQGWGNDQVGNNLATSGGTGSGLTVNVADGGSGYSNIVINTPGSGYTNGDEITVTSVDESISETFTITASVRGIWTHVAISSDEGLVTVYYNGVEQSSIQRNLSLTDASNDLYIGRRGNNDFQYFDGNLALIRISNVAKYATAFSPSISYGVEADTVLFLGLTNPLVDTSYYELNGLGVSAQNGGTLYFAKSTYPNLDKQVQVGNTVVDADEPTNISVTTGAVFTADPDNWGVSVSPALITLSTVNFSGARHTITNTGVVRTNDVPSFQSLQFNNPQQDFLMVPASSDWNLDNNWTIEFWIRSNNNSADNINIPGGQWGLINQGGWYYGMPNDNCILVGLAAGNLTINQSATDAIEFTEPTTRVWTHIAIVNNGGGSAQKIYYNGVEQAKVSGSYTTNGKTNTSDNLYIGRLAPNYNGYFDGKMAMVRISNTAKYLGTFNPITTYGVEADTVLFLDKVNSLDDSSASDHNIVNNGVTVSTDFPAPPTYMIALESLGEGSFWSFSFVGTNLPVGTYYYTTTAGDDIQNPSGQLGTVTETTATTIFSRESLIVADGITEGPETFTVSVRFGSTTGTILVTSNSETIIDSSNTLTSTYVITPEVNNVNEGSALTINVTTTNVPGLTQLYWTVSEGNNFVESSGNFTITNQVGYPNGTFEVTPTADATTEGSETFTVSLRTGSISGTVVATSDPITINDTSTTPP